MTTWTEYGIQEILEIALKGASQPTSCDFHLIGGNATNLTKDAGATLYSGSTLEGQQLSGSDATRSFSGAAFTGLFTVSETDSATNRQAATIDDVVFTASSGDITSAYGAVLVVNGYVWACFEFTAPVTVTQGGTLTLRDCELQISVS